MSELKWTPGPWTFARVGNRWFVGPSSAGDATDGMFDIASIHVPNYHSDGVESAYKETEANACLMAAAPEMAEAGAEALICLMGSQVITAQRKQQAILSLRAALRKARGEER